jgi:hypothetical protein
MRGVILLLVDSVAGADAAVAVPVVGPRISAGHLDETGSIADRNLGTAPA